MTRALPAIGAGLLLLFVGPAVVLLLFSLDGPSFSTILVASLTGAAAASIFVYGFRARPFYEPELQTPLITGGGDEPSVAQPEPRAPVRQHQTEDTEQRLARSIRLTKRRTRRRRSFTRVDWQRQKKHEVTTPVAIPTDEEGRGQEWGDVATLVDQIAAVLKRDLELIQRRREGSDPGF
jgi:hypothetical protein